MRPLSRARLRSVFVLIALLLTGLTGPSPAQSAPPAGTPAAMHRIVLLGPPAAGKSTLAKGLHEALGVPHFDLGDILRTEAQRGTPLGKQVGGFMERGDLVPDTIVFGLLFKRLGAPECAQGFILDGFPRTLAQAQALDSHLEKMKIALTRVLHLVVSADRLEERRLIRFRADDQEEVNARRHASYERETKPLLEFYGERNLLQDVNGNQRPPEVLMEALQRLF